MEPGNAERLQWIIEQRHSSCVPYDAEERVTDEQLARLIRAAC
jgi:hypothetical protein